jgi:hypothetical protein
MVEAPTIIELFNAELGGMGEEVGDDVLYMRSPGVGKDMSICGN